MDQVAHLKTPTQELLDCLWTLPTVQGTESMENIIIHFAKILACETPEGIVALCQEATRAHFTPEL